MFTIRKYAAIAVSLGTLALSGCLSGGGDDKKTDDTPPTSAVAKAAATASLANAVNAAYNALNGVATNSTAVDIVVARGMVSVPASPKLKEQVLSRVQSLSKSRLSSRISNRVASRTGEIHALAEDEIVTDDVFAQFLGTAIQDGNTITYTLNADVICEGEDDPYTAVNEETECRADVANITVVQTVVDSDTGTLTFKVGTAAPVLIGYDPSSLYLEISLADIKAASIVLDSTTADDFGTTFVGAVRLTLAVTNATAGAESVAVTLGVTTAINVAGTSTKGSFSLQIAASDDLFEISADADDGTATISVDIGEVHASFDGLTTAPELLHLGGLTGAFTLSDDGNLLTGTNVGINGELYYDSDTGNGSVKERLVTLPAFNFEIHGGSADADPEIHVLSELNFDEAIDEGGVDDGTLAVTLVAGTEIMLMTDMDGMGVSMVMAGSVNVSGTDAYADGGPINAMPYACYSDNVSTDFPIAIVACPAMM